MVRKIKTTDLQIRTPARMVISGVTNSGKTTFCYRLIKSQRYMLQRPADRILYFYTELNPVIEKISQLPKVEIIKGFNYDLIEDHDGKSHLWCFIDDHIHKPIYDQLAEIYCVTSRAKQISISFLTQNIFSKAQNASKYNRQILLNSSCTILFENRRDEGIVSHIGRSAFPGRYKFFLQSYRLACDLDKSGHGYILIQSDPGTKREVELRSRIFFKSEVTVLFWERGKSM